MIRIRTFRRTRSVKYRVIVCALVLLSAGCQSVGRKEAPEHNRLVTRVVDGDTIILDSSERVRLIGVDTPESVDPRRPLQFFGKEATAYTRGLLEGKKVRLSYEGNKVDHYGRTLAYVYLIDGRLANAEIIRDGYGFAYTKYPFSKVDEFRALERDARNSGRGLWASRF